MMSATPAAASTTPYAPAVIGLAGSLIGGAIAGLVTLLVARQGRGAAAAAWIRDNRRDIYGRILRRGQQLLIVCEAYWVGSGDVGSNSGPVADESGIESEQARVDSANADFFAAYVLVQIVAGNDVFKAARDYAYRLWELAASLSGTSVMAPSNFPRVSELVRDARHDLINAVRAEFGFQGTDFPDGDYNPFDHTDLAQAYVDGKQVRPGPAAPLRSSRA